MPKSTKPDEMKVGMILAKSGAWQRKYKVVRISEVIEVKEGPRTFAYRIVELKFLGRFFADGRSFPANKNAGTNEHQVTVYLDTTTGKYHPIYDRSIPYYSRDYKFKGKS